MKILHISSELASIAKAGGLGDAVFGLAQAQAHAGHSSWVVLPYYSTAQLDAIEQLRLEPLQLSVQLGPRDFECRVWQGCLGPLQVVLLELLDQERSFQRPQIYGYGDDPSRFLAFNCACLSWLRSSSLDPEIIHLHDWPAAAFSALTKGEQIPTLLTLHNVEHQGWIDHSLLARAQIDTPASSLLELGLRHVTGISAVSRSYLEEIQTPEGGRGLETLLRELIATRPSQGIINGIDESYWDPSSCELASPYQADRLTFFEGVSQAKEKSANKLYLQQQLGLECDEQRPLVACISRLVPQKGLDLIEHALYQTLEFGGQFVLLGASPIPEIERHFQRLEQQLQGKVQARVQLCYSEKRARQLFAAADLMLIPSLFEPCGLTQLIGFRYGALAIVRETGGLKDTVIDIDHHPLGSSHGNGFSFLHPDFRGIAYALGRALKTWKEQPALWHKLVQRVMQQDVSWRKPSQEYLTLYQRIQASYRLR